MAYRGACIDWISHLPPEIIEKILTLLPVEQAVKTSILSRSWRYKWTSIPDLDFQYFRGTALNLVKGINKFLHVHQGPIRKFTVKARSLTAMRKVDQWMHLLPKQDISDLLVEFGGLTFHKVPSCLFDCKKLTHLKLSYCCLDVPPNFEGFLNLKTLELDLMVVDSNIGRLIWKSPLLESLSLYSYNASDTITISAPKVKFLNLQGHFKDIYLEESPLLADMSLHLNNEDGEYKLIKFLGGARNLEKLTVELYVYESKICCNRGALSKTFNYLKLVTLSNIFLGESEAIPLVLELLTSAPNLEKLVVECKKFKVPPKTVDSSFWQKEYSLGHCFMKLKEIHMKYIYCVAPEIHFVKFMLQSSPVLEKVEIRTMERRKVTVGRMLEKLPELHQATRAVITFHHEARIGPQ